VKLITKANAILQFIEMEHSATNSAMFSLRAFNIREQEGKTHVREPWPPTNQQRGSIRGPGQDQQESTAQLHPIWDQTRDLN